MLTLKQIYDDKARVIAGLEKKHFAGAAEAIDEVLRLDAERKAAQQQKDAAAAQMNQISKSIGMLMAKGQRAEAEAAKAQTGELKAQIAEFDQKMSEAEEAQTKLLLTIPNVPYDIVPEGSCAEDNLVVKSNVPHHGGDTVGTWVGEVNNDEAKLPHWELA
jgi:seryl-tRNA synthetase